MSIAESSNRKTVELFCGIGGFRVAADKLGLKTVWANDFGALACSVYRDRFGQDVLHEGDINGLLETIPSHDILTGGFPCQPFSAAGKKEGTRDPRGTLFQAIVECVKKSRPRHFVLENVKRLLTMEHGAHFATVLSALSSLGYFVEWRVLNAKHFGLAQNRERVVLVGTRMDDLAIGPSRIAGLVRLAPGADLASGPRGIGVLLAQPSAWRNLERHGTKFPFWGVTFGGKFLACDLERFSAALPEALLKGILEAEPEEQYDFTKETLERLHKNERVDRFVHGVEIISNQGGGARMGYTIFGVGGLAPTLTASTSRHYERYQVGERYRRLTPREYARLQGFQDQHCSAASNYDQYSLYGNAVPPPLVEWVLRQVVQARSTPLEIEDIRQPELFSA
jgi:DNA (cytosine-5)-methyltransferase 1